jgi:hypothetical protein
MADRQLVGIHGGGLTSVGLAESVIRDFRASLRAGEAGCEDARKFWNRMIDRRPGLIAQSCCVAGVINSVDFAPSHEHLLAVRGAATRSPATPSAKAV